MKNFPHPHKMVSCAGMRAGVVMAVLLSAVDAHADNSLLSQFIDNELESPSKGVVPPSGRFRLKLPHGFLLQETTNPDTTLYQGELVGVETTLIVRRVDVTPGAASSQLMLTTRDKFLRKLPNFTVLVQGVTKIAGRKCATMTGRYDYEGNKGYPQIIENAYLVDGADGFIIHMEGPEALHKAMQRELIDVYRSFKTIRVEKSAAP